MVGDVPWLDTVDPTPLPSKARRLARLARCGLRVPRGVVVAADPIALTDEAVGQAVRSMLAEGGVVVRSALAGEDEAEGSAAGLGRSRLGCRSMEDVHEALADLATQRNDPWLAAYRRGGTSSATDCAIIQREVPRRLLLVIAIPTGGSPQVEAHERGGEALAEGHSPMFAGPLRRFEDASQPAVTDLVEETLAELESTEHGHDLEIVVAPDNTLALVQARPLAAPLHPGWNEFRAVLVEQEQLADMHGVLTLDAEHNPAPLSPAHAWLMGWLREQRPKAGDPTVLAGWLYVRTLPRNLAKSSGATPPGPSAVQLIETLHQHTLPHARKRLQTLQARLASATRQQLITAFEEATDAFLDMIDTYVGVLIPTRVKARRATAGQPIAADNGPLSTHGRDDFLDVLPAVWDLASPSLADLGTAKSTRRQPLALPKDEATAATLLGEWDDHLFALGLAPLRAWFQACGQALGLGDDVFMLEAPEVLEALRSSAIDLDAQIETRRARQQRYAQLRPPLRIDEGQPVAFGRRQHLRGIPLGPSFEGALAPRSDLAALLENPPPANAIVTMPALTAPAAVALAQLGIRAVCCEHGGALSHAALMARELGLSALIGCRGCTDLTEGRRARLDTRAGRLVLASD